MPFGLFYDRKKSIFDLSKKVTQHLHMRQYVAKPRQECKSELIVGAGLERVRWTVWYSQFWWLVQWSQGVCIKEQMVLEMPSENRQCRGRGNMGGQLIPDLGFSGCKRFWSGHWCFPHWCRYGSQCSPARTRVVWQYRDFCATRARVFWTNWTRARFDADVPVRRELQ